jgi:hypothetical protein
MPLDHVKGEVVGDLGHAFRVVSNAKWRETPLFEEAARNAEKAFSQAGALLPISFDDAEVLTQEYPAARKLVMIFAKKIRGSETFFPWIWDLPEPMVRELKALGKWDDTAIN